MNRDYTSYDQRLDIDPFEEMENKFRNSNDDLYIVYIKNGKAKISRTPEEEKAFKLFVDKVIEKR